MPQDDRAAAITVVVGVGEAGKTVLAVQASDALREHFLDGRLYDDLRGTDRNPADPHAVLAGFLRTPGAADGSCPAIRANTPRCNCSR